MSTPTSSFTVVVRSPETTIWEGKATAVSSENSSGRFDILAEHANFVTMLNKNSETTIIKEDGTSQAIPSSEAVLAVMSGKVKIYTQI